MCLVDLASVVGFVVGSAAAFSVGSPASSVGSHVSILQKLFIGNILLLMLWRTALVAVNNNHKLFKIGFFQAFLYLFQNPLIQ